MKLSRKTYTIIFIAVAVIIALAVILYFVFRDPPIEDPNKTNTPVPAGSPTNKWVAESFPLTLSMYGSKIKVLQAALGFTGKALDGYLGTDTQSAILTKGYSLPLSQSDYNTIITSKGTGAAQNIKGAYAKYDNVVVRYKNLDPKRTVSKDSYLGRVTGLDIVSGQEYWEIDGIEYVLKGLTYLKS